MLFRSRFAGRNAMESSDDTDVMATDKANSALNREHHQFEYDPPGLAVTTSSETPIACVKPNWLNIKTVANPKRGMKTNCMVIPDKIARLFVSWCLRSRKFTVADRPKMRKNNSRLEIVQEMATPVESSVKNSSSTIIALNRESEAVLLLVLIVESSDRCGNSSVDESEVDHNDESPSSSGIVAPIIIAGSCSLCFVLF